MAGYALFAVVQTLPGTLIVLAKMEFLIRSFILALLAAAMKRLPEQKALPIVDQIGDRAAAENVRLLNCWLGIATRDNIGDTFCKECEYLETCKSIYLLFDGTRKMHPAARARLIMRYYGIESEYLEEYEEENG